MSKSLQDQVENFLSKASYITFAIKPEEKVLSILFDKDGYDTFKNNDNYKNLRRYFKGRRIKLVVVSKDLESESSISLVDTQSLDTIILKGPKFVNGNIHRFFEAKLPEDTIFKFIIMGKSKDNSTLLIPQELASHKTLEIHGYSVVDNRSSQ